MADWTIEQALQAGLGHHQAGRMREAEEMYRQVLARQPNQPDALHLLGVIAMNAGHAADAIELIRQAISIRGEQPLYLLNLATAYVRAGRMEEGMRTYTSAIKMYPEQPDAYLAMGGVLAEAGRFDEAIEACQQLLRRNAGQLQALGQLGRVYFMAGRLLEAEAVNRRAIELNPRGVEGYLQLGTVLRGQGRLDEAIRCFETALHLNPNMATAYSNMGSLLCSRGRYEEAVNAYHSALRLMPGLAEAHNNLGNLLQQLGRYEEAIISLRRALELKPELAEGHNTLGTAYYLTRQFDEATACYERALSLNPSMASAHSNMGNVLRDTGRTEEAVAAYRRAMALDPASQASASNLLFAIHSQEGLTGGQILLEHERWRTVFADPLKREIRQHGNDRRVDRRLRVGYVSPDFRAHPVGQFLLPLFQNLRADEVEIVCYADVPSPDEMTGKLRAYAGLWQETFGMPDERLADLIHADGIDILVDLALHTERNRMLVFARKPAPVQMTWLAYAGTSGLETMDYRLTDAYLDPQGSDVSCYSEESVRLETYWCYAPMVATPEAGPPPVENGGCVTFGSLNSFHKVSARVMDTWAALLKRVEGSRLLVHVKSFQFREKILAAFVGRGIDAGRIAFSPSLQAEEYFAQYHRVDIALDPFPYGGGTTTCDALWMGVPVVTLAGRTAVGRGGVSILSHVGLPELIARTEEEYVEIAARLAGDVGRLKELRAGLRGRMQGSVLMDGERFARGMERVYREVWGRWCAGGSSGVL